MLALFNKFLTFNQDNKPCRIIKNDGIVCYVKFIKNFKWVNEELKEEFTVSYISNTEEEISLSSFEIKDILPIEGE
jgi:hypothetical protein